MGTNKTIGYDVSFPRSGIDKLTFEKMDPVPLVLFHPQYTWDEIVQYNTGLAGYPADDGDLPCVLDR